MKKRLDRKHIVIIVGFHFADGANESTMLAFSVNADQVHEFPGVEVSSLTFCIPEMRGFDIMFRHELILMNYIFKMIALLSSR